MKTLITFTLFIFCTQICAQKYPVHVNTQLSAPYSPYLSDYTTPGTQNFAAHIFANDISLSDYPCKLRLSIEGPGITLRTKTNFLPHPIYIQGGVPLTLYGDDLHEYFHPDNLDLSGLPEYRYEKTQKLPEGIYRFTVEVLDYNRGTVVSNKGTTIAWIMLNDPPILQFPSNFSTLRLQDPVNILFSWTPRNTGSPNAAFATEYTFRLIELWADRNSNDAFLTQAPLHQVTTSQNQLHFGPSEPQLIPGRKYAWQVQAQEPDGRSLFKNNGRSEVYVFQFGEALAIPANLRMRWAKPTTLAIQWDAVKRDDGEIRYRLQYRPRLRRENHEWYETWTRFTEKTLYNLQTNTEYEMRIRSENALQESAYSEIREFKTLREEAETFVCRDVPPPPLPDNTVPVFPLSVNDTIHAGGYNILVRDVIKVGSKYYGSGMAIVPWFNGAKVRVTFENITVNDRLWLTSGTINSVWNSESSLLLEEQTPIAPGKAPEAGELDITVVKTDSLITIDEAVVVSVSRSDVGDIVVTTSDGEEKTLPKGESYAIVDEAGNGYVVDEQGNIAKTTSAEASATATRGSKKYNLAMSFFAGESAFFGFDEKRFEGLSSYYQQMDDGTYVPWKALSSSRPDVISGKLNNGDISIDQITFEAGSSPIVPLTRGESDATLQLHGRVAGLEEELLALYRSADSIPPTVVGKVNLVTYSPINYNLAIVPVNGAALPGGLDARSTADDLNNVYRQAVVEWNVTVLPGLQVPLPETFDEGETGLLSNYTDDMKKVLRAFGPLRDNTYYIFLVSEPRNQSTLGYMPRNRQAGFVFTGPHHGNATEFVKTLAHELGHGAFNLQHTFKEHNIPAGTTDNVMDYSNGTALYKYQWDHIHQPQSVIGLFEGGEEGASIHPAKMLFYETAASLLTQPEYKEWAEKVRKVYEFFSTCDNDQWESYQGSGIIPHCFWRDQEVSSSQYYSNEDLPFTAGLIDGGYIELEGIYKLPDVLRDVSKLPGKTIYAYTLAYWQCRTEKLVASAEDYEYVIGELAKMDKEGGLWNWVKEQWYDYKEQKADIEEYFQDCRNADDLREAIDDLYQLASNWEEMRLLSQGVLDALRAYWEVLETDDNNGRYQRGKLIVPAASIVLPLGTGLVSKAERFKDVLKILTKTSKENLEKVALRISQKFSIGANYLKLTAPLRKIYDDCIKAGYSAVDEGAEIVFRSENHHLIAKISGNTLSIKIPMHHGLWATQTTTGKAIRALEKANRGDPLYRLGGFGESHAAQAQYWSLENPLNIKDINIFSKKYGLPPENLEKGKLFVEIGYIKENMPRITREAPGFGNNPGGSIEVVVPENGVKLESFHTISFD